MNNTYKIEIQGLENFNEFVKNWYPAYSYPNGSKYAEQISNALEDKNSFVELFIWKNGTGNSLSASKLKTVLAYWEKVDILKYLQINFEWELFEKEFEPTTNSTVWKLFLLHLVNPCKFPIFDQHVYRSYVFFKEGIIKEIPIDSKKKYEIYKTEYLCWFEQLKTKFNECPKKMDQSFFTFGRMLKGLNKYPIQITK